MSWPITIVGGSIIGLNLANQLAEHGLTVRVVEEHENIGRPVQCSGLLSETGIHRTGLDISGIVVNKIHGARIFSPSGYQIKIKTKEPVAYVVDREKLDKKYAKKAEKNGVELYTGRRLIGIRGDSLFIKSSTGRGEMLKTKYLVGADGPNSTIRKLENIPTPKGSKLAGTLQGKIKGKRDADLVEVHLGNFAPGLFGWVIPEKSGILKVGIGGTLGTNLKPGMQELLKKIGYEDAELKDIGSGIIPLGPPPETCVQGKTIIIGDAANQTKASSGGGIITGTLAAQAAAKAIEQHYTKGAKLTDYDKYWKKEIYNDLMLHWKIRTYLDSLSEKQTDDLIVKANKSKVGEFLQEHGDMDRPSKFVPKLGNAIKFWRLVPDMVKFGMI